MFGVGDSCTSRGRWIPVGIVTNLSVMQYLMVIKPDSSIRIMFPNEAAVFIDAQRSTAHAPAQQQMTVQRKRLDRHNTALYFTSHKATHSLSSCIKCRHFACLCLNCFMHFSEYRSWKSCCTLPPSLNAWTSTTTTPKYRNLSNVDQCT